MEPLIAALHDPDSELRQQAVFALAQLKDARAIQLLIAAFKDADSRVQETAQGALANMGAPAVEPLITSMTNPNSHVRYYAAEALAEYARHAEPQAVESLTAGFRQGDTAVIAGGFRFLLKRAEPGSEDILIQALNDYGSALMAQALLSTHNSQLDAAVRNWAHRRGYRVVDTPSGPVVYWH